jgi:hypothetical protein
MVQQAVGVGIEVPSSHNVIPASRLNSKGNLMVRAALSSDCSVCIGGGVGNGVVGIDLGDGRAANLVAQLDYGKGRTGMKLKTVRRLQMRLDVHSDGPDALLLAEKKWSVL